MLSVIIRLARRALLVCRIYPSPYVGIKVKDINVVCWQGHSFGPSAKDKQAIVMDRGGCTDERRRDLSGSLDECRGAI